MNKKYSFIDNDSRKKCRGFSLLELLVTLSVLVAIAGVGASMYFPALDQASVKVAQAEMTEIIKAIKQFKKDTGYYPNQGIFDLQTSTKTNIGQVDASSFPSISSGHPDGVEHWFYSPANFYQLYESPIKDNATGEEVSPWSAVSGKGWHGPYLQNKEEYIDLGNSMSILDVNDPALTPSPDYGITFGGPATANSGSVNNVYGISDPFVQDAIIVNNEIDSDFFLLDWHLLNSLSLGYDINEHQITRNGRPFLLLYKDGKPRLISSGADGEYGGVNADDYCVKGNNDSQFDDLVVCFN